MEHVDVLVVGAGISGIGAAYHLQDKCPGLTYAILEGRDNLGGTWDLFRYPGIRSDSDMYTLGYRFKPWTDPRDIADGPAILDYLNETAREFGIYENIRFGHWVASASWSSEQARWTVNVRKKNGASASISCRFLFLCSGYYDYDEGYTPEFAGADAFRGLVVHPQKWTDDIDYDGKRVVVIGSGATAVTLVPEMAKHAAHVTMLQRSPTYVATAPTIDPVAQWLRKMLPEKAAHTAIRWKKLLLFMALYQYCRRFPDRAREFFKQQAKEILGADYDVDTHFNPSYQPWDERLCLVPDGDLFRAIRVRAASVVTGRIERFTPLGIQLESGEELEADIIVTATGLKLKVFGGIDIEVDGRAVDPAKTMAYKGLMISDVPNFAFASGYTHSQVISTFRVQAALV